MDNRQRAHLRILLATAIVWLVASAARAQVAETILHRFVNDGTDGKFPYASLIQATDGNFYGTTFQGGAFGLGTVFQITPDNTVTVLHSFAGGTDGARPYAALIQATDGNFYGTTIFGGGGNPNCTAGPGGCGTVFTMTPDGAVTVLHAFAAGTDGAEPYAALIQATNGNFYGTTAGQGAGGGGTVFCMTPDGTVTILHAFGGVTDGNLPVAALIQATDGNFYGTTLQYGASGGGAVFSMTPDGTVTVLHVFAGGTTDGNLPYAALIQATDGNLYGTTVQGGGIGTIFCMTPDGTSFTVLHKFAGGTDGEQPYAALLQATDGNFYGTTYAGGSSASNAGTVFQMTPDNTVTILYAFADAPDGASPYAAVIQATDGNFYGTTFGGGSPRAGVVYELSLGGLAPTTTTVASSSNPSTVSVWRSRRR